MSSDAHRDRIAAGENETTEFKSGVVDESAARVVCSFLNSKGGQLYLGIDDNGRPVDLGADLNRQAQDLEIFLKQNISPTPFLKVEVITIDDVRIVLVDVPQGLDGPYVFHGGVWLRTNATTKAANISQLRSLLRNGSETDRWERQLSPLMTEGELDREEIRSTVREAERNRRFSFSDQNDDRLVLKDLSVLAMDGVTNAGDVLFSRTPVRRHPQCRVQLVAFSGDKSDANYDDNRWFEGPLVRVCTDVINVVSASNATRSEFPHGEARRIDRPAYDPDALREGLVNAFVHRDYSAYSGGLRVSIYADRIEIWNSGSLPQGLKPKDLGREHSSILVNPDLAQVFYLRGLMERIGRGTELIVKAAKRLGAPVPQWRDTDTGVTLTIFSAHTRSGSSFNLRQTRLLEAVSAGESLTLKDYRANFASEITDRQARRDLDELVRRGLLVKLGSGPSTAYRRQR